MLSTRYAHSARMGFPCTWPEPEDRVPLYIRDGTQFREAQHEHVLKHARSLVAERVRPDAPLLCMPEIKEFLWLTLAPRHRSTFAALLLDYRFRLINFVELFEGTATGVWVHRREIVRVLLEHNCSVVRNETSGVAEPSASDERDYRELREGLALIDIRVLDYFVVGGTLVSLAEREAHSEEPAVAALGEVERRQVPYGRRAERVDNLEAHPDINTAGSTRC